MIHREVNIIKSSSFFLFGARGTGKTSLIQAELSRNKHLWIDLLQSSQERMYADNPDRLSQELNKLNPIPEWVIIDGVQKVPRLLDVVHREIEERKIKFALTGSSARKLKRGAANLLAGRAFVFHLFPFTYTELAEQFDLDAVLLWGTLPIIAARNTIEERRLALESYVDTYLREEVVAEQLVRNLHPFRRFLEVCAQCSGTPINYSTIAQDINADPKTVKAYFDIMEETLIGFHLPAFQKSFRKQQLLAPKFYLFDLGVKRALDRSLVKDTLSSQEMGVAFEHFIVNELFRRNSYRRARYQLSHLRTKGGLEIDLVMERADKAPIFIEIKASNSIQTRHLEHITSLKKDFPKIEAVCICREERGRVVDGVKVLPWREGINEIFGMPYQTKRID